MASVRTLDVTVLLLEGGYPSTAIGPIEVFHSAGSLWNRLLGEKEDPRFRVRVASIDGKMVQSLCGLGITPQCAIRDIRKTDIIILPASGLDLHERISRDTSLLPWLRRWHARGAWITGICSGVAYLAEAGLLDGKRATTHWAVADAMRERYPLVTWLPEQFVTEDGRVLCSGGLYAAIDASLYLVEKFCGHEIALQCAKSMLVSMPRGSQSGFAALPLSRPHADDRIKQAEKVLQQNFDRSMPIDKLAANLGMSPRTLMRRFKAATGRLPGAYVQALRMSAARDLLERSNTPIKNVCEKIGYEDVAFFRSLFKRHTGMTPAKYRSNFANMALERGELRAARSTGR